MPSVNDQKKVINAYRIAAQIMWGLSARQVSEAIRPTHLDKGEWAPNGYGVIYFEYDALPYGYYSEDPFTPGFKLDAAAGKILGFPVFQEYINAAVAGIYDA